jgi:hypothetical protein
MSVVATDYELIVLPSVLYFPPSGRVNVARPFQAGITSTEQGTSRQRRLSSWIEGFIQSSLARRTHRGSLYPALKSLSVYSA